MLSSVLKEVRERESFLVTAHARPDGDAVGSLLACGMALRQLGKSVDMVLADRVPMIYETLPEARCIRHVKTVNSMYDAVILLECDSVQRARIAGLEGQFLINMDHHTSGRRFADVNWIKPDACAVAEMVYELALAAGCEITAAMASCLYAAVLTDTGSFAYEGVTAKAFDLAAALVRYGARPARIAQDIYFSNPTSKMRILGAALNTLQREGRMAWMWVTQEAMQRAGAAEEDCEGLVNYAISLSGVDAAVLLRELPDHRIRLSIRSKAGVLNVAQLAERFGGGGHESASGCTLDGPLHETAEMFLNILRAELGHGGTAHTAANVPDREHARA